MLLQILGEHKLYAKLSKCEFYQGKIQCLAHIISKEGMELDPKNIEAIMEWPTLKNVTNVRYFMGLLGYYKVFIKGFSKIAHLIIS